MIEYLMVAYKNIERKLNEFMEIYNLNSSEYNETNLSNFRFQGELTTFNNFSCLLK